MQRKNDESNYFMVWETQKEHNLTDYCCDVNCVKETEVSLMKQYTIKRS